MRLIAVLGVLFVLASCSDSDIEDLEFSCFAKFSPPNFILSLDKDMNSIKMTLGANQRTSYKTSYFFYPYYETSEDIYFFSDPPKYMREFDDIEIIFNKAKSSITVRETTIERPDIEFSGCEQIK